MLLTKQLDPTPCGGRAMLSKLNHQALKAILGDNLIVFELPSPQPSNIFKTIGALRGHIDGLTSQSIAAAIDRIHNENVLHVFVDGSNLGGFAAKLKRKHKHIEVITFFHNIEARFFWGSLLSTRTLRQLVVFIANFLAEHKAARFSDKRLCLSERDSRLLKKLYGKVATDIIPIALETLQECIFDTTPKSTTEEDS